MSANVLSIFDEIKIENTSRIDLEDKQYCEKHNKIYQETLKSHKETLKSWISLYNNQIKELSYTRNGYTYTEEYMSFYEEFGIDKLIDNIIKLKERFIGVITYYFGKKYNVTIDDNKIFNKYKDIYNHNTRSNPDKTLKYELITYVDIDYNTILDEIFIVLGGYSFKEKSINEIKEKARTPLKWYEYRKYWNYEVKNKTIKFKTNIDHIKPALYFFDNNEINIIDCYTHNKIDSYKHYENSNTDIKFYNASDALDFAKRYLGYIEMTEEQREEYKKKC